jgi:ferric-dicitrate binding protein FerR (iron transport regulator)
MGRNMQRIDRRIFIAGLGLIGLAPLAASAQTPNVAGKVDEAIGLVTAEGRDSPRPLAPQATVFVGDTVATGNASKLGMKLGQETVLRLGELARIKIDRYLVSAGGSIQLNAGPLLLDKPRTAPPVNIRSPFGLISVRGTRVFAGPSRGVFGVFVQHGRVTVTAGGKTVTLEDGFGTDIARRGAAPTPPASWGEERIRLALASVS